MILSSLYYSIISQIYGYYLMVDGSISLIIVMGLLAEECGSCREAAQARNGGGLAGSWWRAWGKVRCFSFLTPTR